MYVCIPSIGPTQLGHPICSNCHRYHRCLSNFDKVGDNTALVASTFPVPTIVFPPPNWLPARRSQIVWVFQFAKGHKNMLWTIILSNLDSVPLKSAGTLIALWVYLFSYENLGSTANCSMFPLKCGPSSVCSGLYKSHLQYQFCPCP